MAAFRLKKKTSDELKEITDEVVKRVIDQDALRIDKIILYGSYARGTADDESDIDIMILCDNDKDKIQRYEDMLRREADHVGYEHDIFVQAKIKGKDEFDYWLDTLPFYKNVSAEGVLLYG